MGCIEFVNMAKKGEILGYECKNCGMHSFRGVVCPFCGSRDLREEKVSKEGKIVTYTKIFVSPAEFSGETPYIVALIELSNGMRVMGRVKKDDVEIGEEVKFCGVKESAFGTALMFE